MSGDYCTYPKNLPKGGEKQSGEASRKVTKVLKAIRVISILSVFEVDI
jgi:hypothetical protein